MSCLKQKQEELLRMTCNEADFHPMMLVIAKLGKKWDGEDRTLYFFLLLLFFPFFFKEFEMADSNVKSKTAVIWTTETHQSMKMNQMLMILDNHQF